MAGFSAHQRHAALGQEEHVTARSPAGESPMAGCAERGWGELLTVAKGKTYFFRGQKSIIIFY